MVQLGLAPNRDTRPWNARTDTQPAAKIETTVPRCLMYLDGTLHKVYLRRSRMEARNDCAPASSPSKVPGKLRPLQPMPMVVVPPGGGEIMLMTSPTTTATTNQTRKKLMTPTTYRTNFIIASILVVNRSATTHHPSPRFSLPLPRQNMKNQLGDTNPLESPNSRKKTAPSAYPATQSSRLVNPTPPA